MSLDQIRIPRHVAIIMDGNRRWAKKKGLAAIGGHSYVVEKIVEPIIERCGELGIEYLTLWTFSTENWKRDADEVNGLMQLFRKALATKVASFIKKGARLRMIGDMGRFAPDIQLGMREAMEKSEKNTKITVTFAMNYGGRDEILRAIKKLGRVPDSEEELARYLDTAGMPDPDLIIRTGGEQRTSGFMSWQAAYAELYFTETLMPEFTTEKFDEAIEDYQGRQRRFGK